MYHTAVQLAISRNTFTDLRDAFHGLTVSGWNKIVTVRGNEVSVTEKRNLLAQVCGLLEGCDILMPAQACLAFGILPGSTYADGVAHTRANGMEPV